MEKTDKILAEWVDAEGRAWGWKRVTRKNNKYYVTGQKPYEKMYKICVSKKKAIEAIQLIKECSILFDSRILNRF